MARASVAPSSSRAQTTDAPSVVSDVTHDPAEDGRTFENLIEARQALWRELCALDDPMTALEGDLSAIEGLALTAVERHADQLGPTAAGLYHCAARALVTLRQVREVQDRLGDAALVVRENDPTKLSRAAVRHRPGPHVSTYGAATAGGGR